MANNTNTQRERIGGGWTNENNFGTYYSLSIDTSKLPREENIRITMFPAREKKTDRSPDFNVFYTIEEGYNIESGPAKTTSRIAPKPAVKTSSAKPAPKTPPKQVEEEPEDELL
ncbi:MAG: hypothetical protein Q8O88_02015 [bacterium]|nr:hypothetical protein [bacterium]